MLNLLACCLLGTGTGNMEPGTCSAVASNGDDQQAVSSYNHTIGRDYQYNKHSSFFARPFASTLWSRKSVHIVDRSTCT